ncbi:3481_t:CDS:2 [Dentiscutata erythropus]|uniref:3481_t:CDS:1 n=1 Tax=Dentiscutata erythropus TaxID=1348616 RepID=A0A9N9BTR0_9GLOM|nr:3481_t:CDS:2 [Dentiscutata erythropus]
MRNPRGKHANEIISPYLQKKALEFITEYPKNQAKKLKAENIELKSVNRRLMQNNKKLTHKIQSIVPSECEIEFAEQLSNDLEISNNTFGLREELQNNLEFKNEFLEFYIDLENITLRLKETREKRQKQLPIISESEQKIFGKEVATKIFFDLCQN